MNRYVQRGLYTVLFTGGLWLAGTQMASADTGDSNGLLNTPISVPVNVGDVSVSLLGGASSTSGTTGPATGGAATASNDSLVQAPINIPVNLSDVSVSLLGGASSTTDRRCL